jgi:hypothetical protein
LKLTTSGIQKSLTADDGQHLPAGSFLFYRHSFPRGAWERVKKERGERGKMGKTNRDRSFPFSQFTLYSPLTPDGRLGKTPVTQSSEIGHRGGRLARLTKKTCIFSNLGPKKTSLDSGRVENRSASIRLEKPRNSRENEGSGDSRSEKRGVSLGESRWEVFEKRGNLRENEGFSNSRKRRSET